MVPAYHNEVFRISGQNSSTICAWIDVLRNCRAGESSLFQPVASSIVYIKHFLPIRKNELGLEHPPGSRTQTGAVIDAVPGDP